METDAHGVIARRGRPEAEAAAARVRAAIEEAKEKGYVNAWYSYVRRYDVELMLEDRGQ